MSHGFLAAGKKSVYVSAELPNSGVFVLPSMTAPAPRRRSTTAESNSGTQSANAAHPSVVFSPAVSSRSFTQIGTPCSGNGSSPATNRASAALAASIAPSPSSVMKALS